MARLVSKHHEKFEDKTLKTDFILLGKIMLVLDCYHLVSSCKQPDLVLLLYSLQLLLQLFSLQEFRGKLSFPYLLAAAAAVATLLWAAIYAKILWRNTRF